MLYIVLSYLLIDAVLNQHWTLTTAASVTKSTGILHVLRETVWILNILTFTVAITDALRDFVTNIAVHLYS